MEYICAILTSTSIADAHPVAPLAGDFLIVEWGFHFVWPDYAARVLFIQPVEV